MIIMDEIQIIKKIINVDQMNKGNVSHLKNYKIVFRKLFYFENVFIFCFVKNTISSDFQNSLAHQSVFIITTNQ